MHGVQKLSFVAPRTGTLTVLATPEADFDLNLSVRSGSSCSTSAEVPSACDDDGNNGDPEAVSLPVSAGTTYWVNVGGYTAEHKGAYTLELQLP